MASAQVLDTAYEGLEGEREGHFVSSAHQGPFIQAIETQQTQTRSPSRFTGTTIARASTTLGSGTAAARVVSIVLNAEERRQKEELSSVLKGINQHRASLRDIRTPKNAHLNNTKSTIAVQLHKIDAFLVKTVYELSNDDLMPSERESTAALMGMNIVDAGGKLADLRQRVSAETIYPVRVFEALKRVEQAIDELSNMMVESTAMNSAISPEWRWGVCGSSLSDKITNDGRTYSSQSGLKILSSECLARCGIPMTDNHGVYKIDIHVDDCEDCQTDNMIGVCTGHYKQNSNQAKTWRDTPYYIGWKSAGGKKAKTPSRRRGMLVSNNSVFGSTYTGWTGDPLPWYDTGDVLSLLYDSDTHTLSFMKNGALLNSKLTHVPANLKLYWCVGMSTHSFKVTIM